MLPARGSFAEIASLFHERVFVSLVAYADESGTHDATGIQPGGEVAVVAGWVAWKEDWDWFDEEWRQALARLPCAGLPHVRFCERGAHRQNP